MKISTARAAIMAAALAACSTPAWAAYVYGPDATYATTEGGGNNIVFDRSDSHTQWVFAPSVFGASPEVIKGFSLRFDSVVSNAYGDTGAFDLNSAFAVKLGTIAGLASTNYAANLANAVTVLSGPQTIDWTIGGPAGATKPWGVTLDFSSPYLYDPTAGALVIDLFLPGQSEFGTLDFVDNFFAAPTANTAAYRVFSLDAASPTGRLQIAAPVIRFDVSPPPLAAVPEPAAWSLLLLGFGGLGAMLRLRRRTPSARPAR